MPLSDASLDQDDIARNQLLCGSLLEDAVPPHFRRDDAEPAKRLQ
ncbi:MAG: hypothetical protein ACFB6S_06790 [Geminicoccaceae bacterium]